MDGDTGCRQAENTPVEPDLVSTSEGMSGMSEPQYQQSNDNLHTTPAMMALSRLEAEAERAADAPSRLRVLSIEGSDPIGGAGTMADMKAFTAQGVFGYAAMTSVLAQNTQGVTSIVNMDPDFLVAQLNAVSDDAVIDSMKIGMLGTPELVEAVKGWLSTLEARYRAEGLPKPVVVLDPVMYAKSGDALLTPQAEHALRSIIAMADIITPNVPELAALADADQNASDIDTLESMASEVCARYGVAVYAKGGALALAGGTSSTDILAEPSDEGAVVRVTRIEGRAVRTHNVHGTGDTLSSTLAALRPQCDTWEQAARRAKTWMNGAIAAADRLHVGKGHGPVDFTWRHAPTGMRFSADYWNRVRPIRERIHGMRFITSMVDATLSLEDFAFYLHQDDIYLTDYTSLLALASSRADRLDERVFFAQAASGGVDSEVMFHHDWFVKHGFDPSPVSRSEVTAAYIGHEHRVADSGSYARLAAVVMPCFWLYAAMGKEMREQVREKHIDVETHPFGEWIRMYSDPEFTESTLREVQICDRLAAQASIDEYEHMMHAALVSSEHEFRFFEQGLTRPALGF